MTHGTSDSGQTVLCGSVVDVLPESTAANVAELLLSVDLDGVQVSREVDDQTVLHRRRAGRTVAPTTNGNGRVRRLRVLDGRDHVLRILYERDILGAPHGVVGPPLDRLLIAGVGSGDNVTFEGFAEGVEVSHSNDVSTCNERGVRVEEQASSWAYMYASRACQSGNPGAFHGLPQFSGRVSDPLVSQIERKLLHSAQEAHCRFPRRS